VDKLTSVQQKVDVMKITMKDSIQQMLINNEKLEQIEAATETLREQSSIFQGKTKQLENKMWWKMWKMRLLIGGLVLAVLLIIILTFTLSYEGSSSKSK
jgi:vesicle-associated membrane protein 72